MKASLTLKPSSYSFFDIYRQFQEGKPLAPDVLNMLQRYMHRLSSPMLDPILKYYLVLKKPQTEPETKPKFDLSFIQKFKTWVTLALEDHPEGVEVNFDQEHWREFKTLIYTHEVMLLHGNQTLTGAPFFEGGVPHVDFFQWGNLMGVVKYAGVTGEIEGNILVHFERMHEQKLLQILHDYRSQHPYSTPEHVPQAAVSATPHPGMAPTPRSDKTEESTQH